MAFRRSGVRSPSGPLDRKPLTIAPEVVFFCDGFQWRDQTERFLSGPQSGLINKSARFFWFFREKLNVIRYHLAKDWHWMRTVNSLDELKMPESHAVYLKHLLAYFKLFPKIESVFLFGSCANGKATIKSDIDLFVLGSEMTDDDEWNIVWNCPKWDGVRYVPYDLMSSTHTSFEEMSKIPGMVQHAIALRGVDLSEL